MATPTSRTVPSGPNQPGQGSPRTRDWSSLKPGEPGSAFRGISRGRGGRGGGVRGGRGGGHPPTNSGQKSSGQLDTINNTPSPSTTVPSVSRKPPVPPIPTATPNGASGKVVNGSAQRGGRPKPGTRKPSRAVPAVVVAPASPSETSQMAPLTPSRANRRRNPQPGKGAVTKPPPAVKTQKSQGCSTPTCQTIVRKDIPPHLVAAHEAEIRHDIDALVERVRAVAMAENRPTTPGSHIDWAGDEDDSLPDLDDWGVTTNAICEEGQNEEISPILADTLKPLPEPNSEADQEEEREMETYDTPSERVESPKEPSPPHSPTHGAIVSSSAQQASEQCNIVPIGVEESSSPALPDGKLPLHPSLPLKPVAAMESLRGRGNSTSKPSGLPPKPPVVAEETITAKTEGLVESIHAPSAEERLALEGMSGASSSERGLAASIHASAPGLPGSHSAPSLLSSQSTSAVPRTHSRSQTEGRPGINQPNTSHRRGRSGATSPLGRHVHTHGRNHSTPAGSAGSRPPHASRPIITGEAISRLARTIGGVGPTPRAQAIPVTKDSTISS